MLAWQAFLDAVDQQAKLQARLTELAIENCLASSQAIQSSLEEVGEGAAGEPQVESRAMPPALDVPFGSITIEREKGVAVAAVHVDVVVADGAFEPAAETRLVSDFKHPVDVARQGSKDIVARSRALLVRRLRSAADLLEAMPSQPLS